MAGVPAAPSQLAGRPACCACRKASIQGSCAVHGLQARGGQGFPCSHRRCRRPEQDDDRGNSIPGLRRGVPLRTRRGVSKGESSHYGVREKVAPLTLVVTGVGFFDFLHGQTGAAPNGIELHPVLRIELEPSSGLPSVPVSAPEGSPENENARLKPWVNTSSGVYHCPGTRWYGPYGKVCP